MKDPTGTTSPTVPSRWWPWKVCAFLLLAVLLSYLDRIAFNVVAPILSRKEELDLDNEELGWLFSAFFWSFALMHLVTGWILDRLNIRVTYALFVALWSLAQAYAGLAPGFVSLFLARLLLGAFETGGQTGAARIISRILPARDRALANGIMMSGGSLGAMLAGPVMIGLANNIGWRAGFGVLAAIGLLWAWAWLLWFRPPAAVLYGTIRKDQPPTAKDQWRTILASPAFWACVAGAACTLPIIHISTSWTPRFFEQAWGLPFDQGFGTYLFFIYLGLDVGFLGGGAAVSYLIHHGWTVTQARKLIMLGSGGLMLAAAAVPWAPRAEVAVLLVFLLNTGRAAWGAIFLAFNQDLAPGRVGMMAAIMGCIGALAGALLIVVIGMISKAHGFSIPFGMIAGLAILGLVPVLLVRWESEESPARGVLQPAPVAASVKG